LIDGQSVQISPAFFIFATGESDQLADWMAQPLNRQQLREQSAQEFRKSKGPGFCLTSLWIRYSHSHVRKSGEFRRAVALGARLCSGNSHLTPSGVAQIPSQAVLRNAVGLG